MHLRNITHFDFVNTGIDFESKLNEIEKAYGMLANSDPLKLRKLIPSNEIWRFFITKTHQQLGRNIKESPLLDRILPYKHMVIYDYLTLVEKTDPKLLNISSKSIYQILKSNSWILCIDELKHFTFQNVLDLDYGWVPYEINEPGYLKSLYYAFNEIFSNKELTIDLIKKIHGQCIAFTRKTKYEVYKDSNKEQFRSNVIPLLHIASKTSTLEGVQEILRKQKHHEYDHLQIIILIDGFKLMINPETLKLIQENYSNLMSSDMALIAKLIGSTVNELNHFPHVAQAARSALLEIYTDPANAVYKMGLLETHQPFLISAPQANMTDKLGTLLNKYNENLLKARTAHHRLLLITIFIQDCAQLVPLDAANGRVFTMIILNMLLVRNGFPLTILEDQNKFIGYSTEQLMSEILKGMENTFTLIKENKLFDVETSVICKKLREANFDLMEKYFHDLQWLEEGFRHEKSARLSSMKNNRFDLRFFCNKTEKDLINQLKNVLEDFYPDGIDNLDNKTKEHVTNMYKLISFLDNEFLTENNRKIIQEYIASLENQIAERNKVRPK